MRYLTKQERSFTRNMKEQGVLEIYSERDLQDITRNGGISEFCGDGDIDVRRHHKRTILGRIHAQQHFGGPLIFSRLFRGYEEAYALGAIKNMYWGMEAKNTQSLFLYPHFPCGVADKFGHSIEEVFLMAAEVHSRFVEECDFLPSKVHSFFHLKRLNRGQKEEQNTYVFNVGKYVSLVQGRIVSLDQAYELRLAAA